MQLIAIVKHFIMKADEYFDILDFHIKPIFFFMYLYVRHIDILLTLKDAKGYNIRTNVKLS